MTTWLCVFGLAAAWVACWWLMVLAERAPRPQPGFYHGWNGFLWDDNKRWFW